jgi:uncharacterized membrane protein
MVFLFFEEETFLQIEMVAVIKIYYESPGLKKHFIILTYINYE